MVTLIAWFSDDYVWSSRMSLTIIVSGGKTLSDSLFYAFTQNFSNCIQRNRKRDAQYRRSSYVTT